MKRHEDTDDILTAFLDGLLDPEARARVEERLAVDPALAEEFRALTTVRDMVGGLSRPSLQVDLSDRVVRALREGTTPTPSWRLSWPSGPAFRQGIRIVGVAAGLLAVASLPVLLPRLLEWRHADPMVVQVEPAPPVPTSLEPVAPVKVESVASSNPAPPPEAAPVTVVERPSPPPAPVERNPETDKFRKLLDSPGLEKRFLLVADGSDEAPSRRVDWLLRDLPRSYPNFVRIALREDQNPDAQRPGPAVVYAVMMDEREIDRLRSDLSHAFPIGMIEERSARPDLVTRLAEVGRAEVLKGTAVADLMQVPGAALASREEQVRDIRLDPSQVPFRVPSDLVDGPSEATPEDDSTPSGRRAAADPRAEERVTGPPIEVDADPGRPATSPPAATSRRPSRSLVLLWVTRPSPSATARP